jgi:peptidyl-prolyl cis-trans isomerase B (cyclophilin B)
VFTLRSLLAPAAVAMLIAACGGGDGASSRSAVPTCGPEGSAIAAIERDMQRSFSAPPEMIIDPSKSYEALLRTAKGDIKIALAAAEAPITVNNFVFLSCHGFYDGLVFHRVEIIPAPFVIQGGDPRGNGTGGPGYRFENEINVKLRHDGPGVVAMANSGADTNGSQFYITLNPAPNLNGRYSIFGRVTDGMDAARRIRIGDEIYNISITES